MLGSSPQGYSLSRPLGAPGAAPPELSWVTLSRRRLTVPSGENVRLDDVILPDTNWAAEPSNDGSRAWVSATSVAIKLFCLEGRGPVPMSLFEARQRYESDSRHLGGVLLELEEVQTKLGPMLRSVFKYHLPQYGPGMYYVGILLHVTDHAHLRLHTEAVEGSPTGWREAAVMVAEPDAWPEFQREPVHGLPHERKVVVRAVPSDHPKWDTAFQHHPLSRVRAQQHEIITEIDLVRPV